MCGMFLHSSWAEKNPGKLVPIGKGLFYRNVKIVDKPFRRFEFLLVNKSDKTFRRMQLEVDFLDGRGKKISDGYVIYTNIEKHSVNQVYIPIHIDGTKEFDLDIEDTY